MYSLLKNFQLYFSGITKSLDKLSENTTTVVVAHKLSSIKDADVIFVLDEGKVVEVGTHSELMKKKKYYANMVNTQNKNSK